MLGLEKQISLFESDSWAQYFGHGYNLFFYWTSNYSCNKDTTKEASSNLVLLGLDGQRYTYLLKGREDLWHARIMQLFSFCKLWMECYMRKYIGSFASSSLLFCSELCVNHKCSRAYSQVHYSSSLRLYQYTLWRTSISYVPMKNLTGLKNFLAEKAQNCKLIYQPYQPLIGTCI